MLMIYECITSANQYQFVTSNILTINPFLALHVFGQDANQGLRNWQRYYHQASFYKANLCFLSCKYNNPNNILCIPETATLKRQDTPSQCKFRFTNQVNKISVYGTEQFVMLQTVRDYHLSYSLVIFQFCQLSCQP